MVIGLVGYFGTLPADLDWIDHTVAFLMFSYFFYILDITSILFGKTSKTANFLIVISYLSLFFKDILSYTQVNAFKFKVLTFVDGLYLFFNSNLTLTNIVTFYIGLGGILITSYYLTRKMEISHPSLLYSVHKGRFKNSMEKFSLILIVLLSNNKKVMGDRINHPITSVLGWLITAIMIIAGVATIISLFV